MGPGATVTAVVGRVAADVDGAGAAVVAGATDGRGAVVVGAAVVVVDDATAVATEVDVVSLGRSTSASSDAPPHAARSRAIARSLRIGTLWWQ